MRSHLLRAMIAPHARVRHLAGDALVLGGRARRAASITRMARSERAIACRVRLAL